MFWSKLFYFCSLRRTVYRREWRYGDCGVRDLFVKLLIKWVKRTYFRTTLLLESFSLLCYVFKEVFFMMDYNKPWTTTMDTAKKLVRSCSPRYLPFETSRMYTKWTILELRINYCSFVTRFEATNWNRNWGHIWTLSARLFFTTKPLKKFLTCAYGGTFRLVDALLVAIFCFLWPAMLIWVLFQFFWYFLCPVTASCKREW